MPKSKKKKANELFSESSNEILSMANLNLYINKYSPERLEGYKDATRDFLDNLGNHFSTGNPLSVRTFRKIISFYNERILFLNALEFKTESKVEDNLTAS